MSVAPAAAHRLFLPAIGLATAADVVALAALTAPHVASGALLPHRFDPDATLVARRGERIVGCVALTPWTDAVVELGTLVSQQRGLGRALVGRACDEAAARGFVTIVALTAVDDFFERCGFRPQPTAPWAHARGVTAADPAVAVKAQKCAACPRLAGCSQILLARALRQRAAA